LSLKEAMQFLSNGLLEVLSQLHNLTGNLGLSILLFTFIIRSLLLPLSLPAIQSQKKIKAMKPELDQLKEKHKGDKKAFQLAQIDLYKKYNLNPLAGCIPQILQIGLLILLYHVLVGFVTQSQVNGVSINPHFFWLDLAKPDNLFVLPVLAGVTQLILSVMILPGGETPDIVPNNSKDKSIKKANEKEEDMAEMANTMQKQMLFMMPVMTGFIALRFPSGVALYWVATTVFSIVQQYFLSGPGGLVTYWQRIINSRVFSTQNRKS
jgi:YidC/Oxa1 family membrane protein insertase